MMTLEQIIEKEQARRSEGGMFGIAACKEAIKCDIEFGRVTLYTLLGEYVERANADIFFNKAMVLACWELINNK